MVSKGTYEKSPGAGSYDTRGNLLGRSPGKSMGLKTDPKGYYPGTIGPGPGGYDRFGLDGVGKDGALGLVGKIKSAVYSMG